MKKEEIYFAGGCFWGVEHFFSLVKGVVATQVGYANGQTENPSYEQVCRNNTGHAETVQVVYDADVVSLEKLLLLFFEIIDPTSLNKQGHDVGTQYRTGIYYTNAIDLSTIQSVANKISTNYDMPIVVEICKLETFYTAEDYHQKYLVKNPDGYCHINPALFELAKNAQ
jgi:peptide methionine sulfoxide reductase msrA/msrB